MKKFAWLALALCLALCAWAAADAPLPDGDYAPDSFSFSGGSGKVTISCPTVHVQQGNITADIVFSSTKYVSARLGDQAYEPTAGEDGATFTIPAPLNTEFSLFATTTAMSAPHEIEYKLFISLGAPADALPGLEYKSSLQFDYARCVAVDFYEGDFALISVDDGRRYLAVPEGSAAPEGLDPAIIVLQKPLDHTYIAGTAVMAFYDRIGALDSVRFSSLEADGWNVEAAAEAMRAGDILYGGKYSEPVYELLVKEDCDLAVESTMILHTPKVQETLEILGIPVFIDRSSYETEPLGRTEWIKVYGVLYDRLDAATECFAAQAAEVEALAGFENTGATVAFFYVNTDGSAVVRTSGDYIARCIDIAGGAYAFPELESDRSTASLSMEEFLKGAANADYLIYDTTIDKDLASLNDLLERSELFGEFAAVRNGNVWLASNALYQATDSIGDFILDLHRALSGGDAGEMRFLSPLH